MVSRQPSQSRELWAWVTLILGAAFLLLALIGTKSLWVDELFTLRVAGQSSLGDLVRACVENERRPPLYYLVLHAWQAIAGTGEFAARLFSVFFALLSLPLLGRLARGLGMERLCLAAAALLAFAPTFVLYAPMVRAYTMAVAAGLLSTILFVEVIERPSSRAWAGYVAAAVVLLYTDYALLSLLAAQNLYIAYRWTAPGGVRRPRVKTWLAAQLLLVLAFVPWMLAVVAQAQHPKLDADFARGLMGYALKLAYPVISLSMGETIFPWNPLALAGLVCVGVLFVAGLTAIFRGSRANGVFMIIFLVTPFLFTAILLSSLATDIPFINMASRTLFAMPFFSLILAAGAMSLRPLPWRMLALTGLAFAWGAAIADDAANVSFHNPIYAVPMRQIVQEVKAETQPGDVIVSDVDTAFSYYYDRSGATAPQFLSGADGDAASQAILAGQSPRIWLVTFGRDRTRLDAAGDAFASWLEQQSYRLADSRGYAPEDPLYQRLKKALLKREDYDYKLLLRRYERR
jgi:uncharacterized membrane protein